MAATSSRRSSSGPVIRSVSPSGRFHLPHSPTSNAFASSTSSFASRSSTLFSGYHQYHRSASPTRVNLYGNSPSAPSVRISLDRPISPNRSISTINTPRGQQVVREPRTTKRTCMCSPTTHPGSFRCSLHKNMNNSHSAPNCSPNTRLNARRSAMTNSLVRICGVEGDLVKRALSALIRPSSHQQRRRAAFQSRPSRLSVMSKAEDL
ncbi:hypothetical protein P3X46_031643 [Hevea brasiliensis]|uniref:Serine-rich protein-like protein n=1 Tax=Hevea brasiliensis TaxID=3981 RepID=A0ABQ9KLP4_HEVBR|nr:uncharacterized protein LOC110669120 [Hevea brasiliensis]KAJ9141063.1 hypothetical protein P3X46_031643 [Hevea brasiliensis]